GLDRVSSGWHFIDLERSHRVGNGKVRVINDADVSVHPIVNVAFEMQHDFFVLWFELVYQAGSRLSDVEGVVLAGQAVDVVQKRIAVLDLNRLSDARAHDARCVHTCPLIDNDRLSGYWSLRKVPLQPDEDIGQTAVDCRDDIFLNDALTRVHPGTHR